MDVKSTTLDVAGASIEVRSVEGQAPGLFWLGGYRSDMAGTKALALEALAAAHGLQSTRFDYSGHGQSGGDFLDGSISRWLGEAMAVFSAASQNGPQILIGSSMGAWIALRMVQELNTAERAPIAGLVLLAPAPDFTVELMEPELTDAQKAEMEAKGYFEEPTPYGPEPNRFTKLLFNDGRENNRVMTGPIDTFCPVHIIQGKQDPDVPWQHAQRLYELLSKDDATLTYVADGDHRLSRDEDIALIERSVLTMAEQVKNVA
ncbi:MAG: alpha/beta hydrolase [Pseudomonadota bacterium]